MFGFLAPLLGAIGGKATLGKIAVGAVTGAINRSNAKRDLAEQRSYDRDSLLRVREDAERAGFNPLTALRNGASNIGSNTYLNSPALSSADFIGQALMDGIDTGFNAPQRKLDAETQRLQNDLYRAQIGELQANTQYLARSHGFGVPAVEQYGVSSDAAAGQNRSSIFTAPTVDDEFANRTLRAGPLSLETRADVNSASVYEERYGDVASSAIGIGVLAADALHSYRKLNSHVYDNYTAPALTRLGQWWNTPSQNNQSTPQPWFADGYDWLK